MTEQLQEITLEQENEMLKQRLEELSSKVTQRTNFIGEIDMAGPSVKLYFANEQERHLVTMVAAQHGMTLPQYMMTCAITKTNEIFAARKAQAEAAAAKASAEAESVEEAPASEQAPETDEVDGAK